MGETNTRRNIVGIQIACENCETLPFALGDFSYINIAGVQKSYEKHFLLVRNSETVVEYIRFRQEGKSRRLGAPQRHADGRGGGHLSLEEAVDLWTRSSADCECEGWGSMIGAIEPGKKADFAILSQDIFTIPVRDIHNTVAEETWLNGKRVYRRS